MKINTLQAGEYYSSIPSYLTSERYGLLKEMQSGHLWIFMSLGRELKYQAGWVKPNHQAALVVSAILEVRTFKLAHSHRGTE